MRPISGRKHRAFNDSTNHVLVPGFSFSPLLPKVGTPINEMLPCKYITPTIEGMSFVTYAKSENLNKVTKFGIKSSSTTRKLLSNIWDFQCFAT